MKILDCKINVTKSGIYPIPSESFTKVKPKTRFILYLLLDGDTFAYVGITTQKIQTRFSSSFYAYENRKNKKLFNGYSGYKWISDCIKDKKELSLFLFEIGSQKSKNDSKNKKLEQRIFAEAIEAELVYLIREKTESWPKYQHEIHFHNSKDAKEIARTIYSKIH